MMFMLGHGMSKTLFQSTSVIVFWAINIFKAIPYGILGIFSWELLLLDLIFAPVALIGVWLGVRAHFWMPERPFFLLTYALLLGAGLRLIWVGFA